MIVNKSIASRIVFDFMLVHSWPSLVYYMLHIILYTPRCDNLELINVIGC